MRAIAGAVEVRAGGWNLMQATAVEKRVESRRMNFGFCRGGGYVVRGYTRQIALSTAGVKEGKG
jgi:hypothetical protein